MQTMKRVLFLRPSTKIKNRPISVKKFKRMKINLMKKDQIKIKNIKMKFKGKTLTKRMIWSSLSIRALIWIKEIKNINKNAMKSQYLA